MSSICALLREATDALQRGGILSPRAEARLFLERATGLDRAHLLAHADRAVARDDAERFRGWIACRARREPAAYILGHVEFWGLRFGVGPGVLVPRPDSETLLEAVIRIFPDGERPLRILDLGVGSGCLLLSVLHEFANARGVGIDASEQALAYARDNAKQLGLDARVELEVADWRDGVCGTFDIVLANPPYVRSAEIEHLEPEVALHEPRGALDGGVDGMDAYRVLAPLLPALVRPGGAAFLEIGLHQAEPVSAIVRRGLASVVAHRDLADIARCLECRHHPA
ncbi:MAG: peptide chain release factor N(5)-glutamine methyltransferase [Geminicoccaceae bacterium]